MKLNDVILSRCGDYFTPHFQSKDKHMNPIEFKKLSREHFYNELYRACRANNQNLFRIYSLASADLDDDEKRKIFALFDQCLDLMNTVDLITLPYRPIGEKK